MEQHLFNDNTIPRMFDEEDIIPTPDYIIDAARAVERVRAGHSVGCEISAINQALGDNNIVPTQEIYEEVFDYVGYSF